LYKIISLTSDTSKEVELHQLSRNLFPDSKIFEVAPDGSLNLLGFVSKWFFIFCNYSFVNYYAKRNEFHFWHHDYDGYNELPSHCYVAYDWLSPIECQKLYQKLQENESIFLALDRTSEIVAEDMSISIKMEEGSVEWTNSWPQQAAEDIGSLAEETYLGTWSRDTATRSRIKAAAKAKDKAIERAYRAQGEFILEHLQKLSSPDGGLEHPSRPAYQDLVFDAHTWATWALELSAAKPPEVQEALRLVGLWLEDPERVSSVELQAASMAAAEAAGDARDVREAASRTAAEAAWAAAMVAVEYFDLAGEAILAACRGAVAAGVIAGVGADHQNQALFVLEHLQKLTSLSRQPE